MADDNKEKKEPLYIIEYIREGCIGAAACVALRPENWFLDTDGKATLMKKEIYTEEEFKAEFESAEACPVAVIHIIEVKTGKKLI